MSDEVLKAKVVEAESFHVRDLNGQIRAYLGVDEDNHVNLTLHDRKGEPRAFVGLSGVGRDIPMIALLHEHGSPRVTIEIDDQAHALIRMYDVHGNPRFMVGVGADGLGSLGFADADGNALISMGCVGNSSSIELSNSGRTRTWSESTQT